MRCSSTAAVRCARPRARLACCSMRRSSSAFSLSCSCGAGRTRARSGTGPRQPPDPSSFPAPLNSCPMALAAGYRGLLCARCQHATRRTCSSARLCARSFSRSAARSESTWPQQSAATHTHSRTSHTPSQPHRRHKQGTHPPPLHSEHGCHAAASPASPPLPPSLASLPPLSPVTAAAPWPPGTAAPAPRAAPPAAPPTAAAAPPPRRPCEPPPPPPGARGRAPTPRRSSRAGRRSGSPRTPAPLRPQELRRACSQPQPQRGRAAARPGWRAAAPRARPSRSAGGGSRRAPPASCRRRRRPRVRRWRRRPRGRAR
jgi:hypothetical protein